MPVVIKVDDLYLKYPPVISTKNNESEYHAYFTDNITEARKFDSIAAAVNSKVMKRLERDGDNPEVIKV